jgi:hypothetical protein
MSALIIFGVALVPADRKWPRLEMDQESTAVVF